MESEGVSLPLIHKHLMVPWNHLGKGDCCGLTEAITDGYFCEVCKFFVHKKCNESPEYIQHPSHTAHTLQLVREPNHFCDLCGEETTYLMYGCKICNFHIDLRCVNYPPPEVIYHHSKAHRHKLTLLKRGTYINCAALCRKSPKEVFSYECQECYLTFHVNCVWQPWEIKYLTEYTIMVSGKGVSLPWIDKHIMMPCTSLRKGVCCERFEAMSEGYYCNVCDFFVHKKCGDKAPKSIKHPSHSTHLLWHQNTEEYVLESIRHSFEGCNICGRCPEDPFYRCAICNFNVDQYCVKYPPPEVIDNSETHHHKLTLFKDLKRFYCKAANCEREGYYEFHYKCGECDFAFHVDCIWKPDIISKCEINHFSHSLHPLTLTGQPVESYSDGKCRLCGRKITDRLFYHCSSCNFTLDMYCVLEPPPQLLLDLKAHDHQLTLLPRLGPFKCNACGLNGDRSPYICIQCDFMIHQDCLRLPRIIHVNRHDHRVYRTSIIGVVNLVCGVCRQKVDWTCGGYSCRSCSNYVVHSKCATRKDVWNGLELEGEPEEIEDIASYVVIDEKTIQHFSHEEHYLSLHVNGVFCEGNKRCRACNNFIRFQSFYGCLDCDFVLHQNCADLHKRKRHMLHNRQLTLSESWGDTYFVCCACHRASNGFVYREGLKTLDVKCVSISEPFVHPSHPHHPLYYIPPNKNGICSGCKKRESAWDDLPDLLMCIEDDCEFFLCFACATIPQLVSHRVHDHPLSLCYGEEKASGKYWCDICEKQTNPKKWFYTCKDNQASLHTKCVVGDLAGLIPGTTFSYSGDVSFEVVLNNSVTRPFCTRCGSHCMYPICVKRITRSGTYTFCSMLCIIRW